MDGCHVCLLFPFITPLLLSRQNSHLQLFIGSDSPAGLLLFFPCVTFWWFYASVWSTSETSQWAWDENRGQSSSPCLGNAAESALVFCPRPACSHPHFFCLAFSLPWKSQDPHTSGSGLCSFLICRIFIWWLVILFSHQCDFPEPPKRPGLL